MANWISSDLHFYHKNVINFCNRPYSSIEEMNEGIINNFNSVVKPDDNLYLLGDISFSSSKRAVELLERMNGHKHLIIGNHDTKLVKSVEFLDQFSSFTHYKEMRVGKHNVVLMHYPIYSWNRKHYGAIHLFGHLHGSDVDLGVGRYKDVGVDTNEMMPYNLDLLVEYLSSIPMDTLRNHHGREET